MTPTLRRAAPKDEPFLRKVYSSTREEELAPLEWDAQSKQQFLDMQFNAQHGYYHEMYPNADYQIIELDGQPAGRLYLDRRKDEIRIVDIALLPDFRGAGAGTSLLTDILNEATTSKKTVRIHVEKFNPAMRLYERLGFTPTADRGVYLLMEWTPDGSDNGDAPTSEGSRR
jgi:ribosomal protein S18 acetylase RimI-like enzyme